MNQVILNNTNQLVKIMKHSSIYIYIAVLIANIVILMAWAKATSANPKTVKAELLKKSVYWDADFKITNNTERNIQRFILDSRGSGAQVDYITDEQVTTSPLIKAPNSDSGNNDQLMSDFLQINKALGPGESFYTIMDYDGADGRASSTQKIILHYEGGGTETLTFKGGTDGQWTAESTPSGPIINGLANATINWNIPTKREDGKALSITEIGGYLVFYGEQSSSGRCQTGPASKDDKSCYPNIIDITNTNQTSQVINHALSSDKTMYYSMVTYETDGTMSKYSNEVSKKFVIAVTEPPPNPSEPPSFNIQIITDCEVVGDQLRNCTISYN